MVDRPPPASAPVPTPSRGSGPAQVVVNGAVRAVADGQPLPDLLVELGLRPGSVVVERNGVALIPSELSGVRLADGDILEIVRAVAGG
ncbi:sulfur carrier protein ThiS [Candidatus Frankia alpina]|uniref:Sulfur carrier protein ThiS n=1 Tax=Candidatus Frankia alpina TaxID=2699483 RepID=A0A4S5ES91_9ACTN|nr:sulfur carrier protein ThiS [Candidatus Frankia alpina]THJ74972.1 sulfur carrier protein ThiS [Candidatus Frankia alpina]